MNIINWKSDMSVGIDSIDNQHKHLVDLINRLYEAMSEGHSKDIMDAVLKELVDYGKIHFKTEEDYFDTYNYPDAMDHKGEHKAFLNTVDNLMQEYESGEYKVSMDTLHFLRDWITHHIKESDLAYGPFLQSKMKSMQM